MKYPGPAVFEPGSKTSQTWFKLVGIPRVIYQPGHWVYDASTQDNIWIEPVFYAFVDYGITSAWFGD